VILTSFSFSCSFSMHPMSLSDMIQVGRGHFENENENE
jgi:hypothetical protein